MTDSYVRDVFAEDLSRDRSYRERLISVGALRPRVIGDATVPRVIYGTGVRLDDAGRQAAAKHLQQGREGHVDHSVFVPSHVWQGARRG